MTTAFLGKKREREQCGEDDRRANENRINAGAHVEQSHHLRDLMDDVRQTGDKTQPNGAQVESPARLGGPDKSRAVQWRDRQQNNDKNFVPTDRNSDSNNT